jgi:hypothetical protein
MKFKRIYQYIQTRKPVRYTMGVLAGAGIGFLYYYFIGCNSGSCPITGNPFNSMAVGGFMGFVWVFSPGKPLKEQ